VVVGREEEEAREEGCVVDTPSRKLGQEEEEAGKGTRKACVRVTKMRTRRRTMDWVWRRRGCGWCRLVVMMLLLLLLLLCCCCSLIVSVIINWPSKP
jgi:hypothetical protein